MNPGEDDLSCAAKKSAPDASPFRSPREVRPAIVVGQAIFFVRRIFETVLLPHLADCDACERSMGGVEGRDRPVWSDRLRYRNQST